MNKSIRRKLVQKGVRRCAWVSYLLCFPLFFFFWGMFMSDQHLKLMLDIVG